MPVDTAGAGASYCIPADPDAAGLLRREKRITVVTMVLGIAGIAAGGVFALVARESGEANENWWLTIAGSCTAAGFLTMWSQIAAARRRVRRRVRQRLGELPREFITPPTAPSRGRRSPRSCCCDRSSAPRKLKGLPTAT